jgi:hypothetical protein
MPMNELLGILVAIIVILLTLDVRRQRHPANSRKNRQSRLAGINFEPILAFTQMLKHARMNLGRIGEI